MAMNDAELDLVFGELTGLVGQRLSHASQPRRDRIILRFEQGLSLLMVPRGPHARIHYTGQRLPNPRQPFSFQGLIRARIDGPLTRLHRVEADRIVELEFGDKTLILRLTGRSGGLWLVHAGNVVGGYDGPCLSLPIVAPRPSPGITRLARFEALPGLHGWNRAAESWFHAEENGQVEYAREQAVLAGGRRHLARLERLVENLEDDLRKSESSTELRRDADTLAASLWKVQRGQTQVELPDLEDPDGTRPILLNGRLSPGQNLEVLYQRARRMEKVGVRSLERLIEVEERCRVLRHQIMAVENAPTPKPLDALARLLPRDGQPGEQERARLWNTWCGPNNARVLVGKNAAANRRLTFRHARGNDWWLHLRDLHGPHIILQVKNGVSPSLETILAAAQIALIASKIDVGARVDVQYTRVKNVKPIPGEEGGRVMLTEERVLHVVRDSASPTDWVNLGAG